MNLSLFYNHVTVLDYAFLDDKRGVVGDSLIVNVEFVGTTDDEGVIFDFSLAKKKVKDIIDLECDHRLVVPTQSEMLSELKADQESFLQFGALSYKTPREGLCLVEAKQINNESLSRYLESILLPQMPKEVIKVNIELVEEKQELDGDFFFHYSHGLKQHYGNCQRLLHGHRSTIKVFDGGRRNSELEWWLVNDQFSGSIHFAFWENVQDKQRVAKLLGDSNKKYGRLSGGESVTISYESQQGEFSVDIPSEQVHIVPIETTVENLSTYFLQLCEEKQGYSKGLSVWAFEGIAKGAKSSL